jgi:hypothetical protein
MPPMTPVRGAVREADAADRADGNVRRETGRPKRLATITSSPVTKFAASACPSFMRAIFLLMVTATFLALSSPPAAMAVAIASTPSSRCRASTTRSRPTILGVSFRPLEKLTEAALQ